MQVNLHDAKTNLSRYVEQALDGEEVVIARAGNVAWHPHGPPLTHAEQRGEPLGSGAQNLPRQTWIRRRRCSIA